MSGPKVVRIVTIEEVLEICRGHLARLDAAIGRWEKISRRNDAVTNDEVAAMRARRAEIAALMSKERYLDLQKRAPEELQWIEADLEKRLAAAARRIADAQTSERRRSALAAQLLRQPTISATLRRDLEAIARGADKDGSHAEAVIGEALRSTAAAAGAEQRSPELVALAQQLAGDHKGLTLDDWLATHVAAKEDEAADDRISAAIAGLAVAGAEQEAAAISQRYDALLAEPSSAARKMRVDSLLLEIGRSLERHRERARLMTDLEQTLAEARIVLGPTHASLVAEAQGILQREDLAALAPARSRLIEIIDAQRKADAAAARRHAVLTALAEVGYQAREGMETATPSGASLVLRRASHPEMGVEIAGGTASARLQMRPVRFAAPNAPTDAGKDRDIETIWCADFDTLHDRLRALDADVAIERATPIGSSPVMVVREDSGQDARRASAPLYRQQKKS